MPNHDRTGPYGHGPGTGKGLGKCKHQTKESKECTTTTVNKCCNKKG